MVKKALVLAGLASVMISGLNAEAVKKGFDVSSIRVESTVDVAVPKSEESKIVLPSENMIVPKPSKGYSDTIISARSSKSSYVVSEPITIQLKLKRDAYIYFWTVGHEGKGYLILPNNFESFNSYDKETFYVVPEDKADYEYISDREGSEKVYVLATNKRINAQKIASIFSTRVGGLVKAIASKKSMERFMTKDLRVIAKEQDLKFVIKGFSITIKKKK